MSDSVSSIVKSIQNLSVSELVALNEDLAQSLGVDTDQIQHSPSPGDTSGSDSLTVVLKSYGDTKIGVIKVVREALGVDLHTAKDVVERCGVLVSNYPREEALQLVERLTEAGASCELR